MGIVSVLIMLTFAIVITAKVLSSEKDNKNHES